MFRRRRISSTCESDIASRLQAICARMGEGGCAQPECLAQPPAGRRVTGRSLQLAARWSMMEAVAAEVFSYHADVRGKRNLNR
jgi:hypothetical protein